MSQKGVAPILIVLLIALAIGGYFLYQQQAKTTLPTPSPTQTTTQPSPNPTNTSPVPNGTGETTSWKTYTDTELGISFKYPDTWEVKTTIVAGPNTKYVYLEIPQEKDSARFAVAVDYIDNPKNLSVKQFQEELNKKNMAVPLIFYSDNSSPVKVAGIDGFYEKNGNCEPYNCSIYSVSYKGKIWLIKLMETIHGKYVSEKGKIVSTFKFTN